MCSQLLNSSLRSSKRNLLLRHLHHHRSVNIIHIMPIKVCHQMHLIHFRLLHHYLLHLFRTLSSIIQLLRQLPSQISLHSILLRGHHLLFHRRLHHMDSRLRRCLRLQFNSHSSDIRPLPLTPVKDNLWYSRTRVLQTFKCLRPHHRHHHHMGTTL